MADDLGWTDIGEYENTLVIFLSDNGQKAAYDEKDRVGGEMGNGKWMRQGDFKAVSVALPYGTGTWHLYNLADDPGETRDLANDQPEILKKLQAAWERYARDVGVVLSK